MTEGNAPAAPAPRVNPRVLRLIHSISQVATLVAIWWVATVGQLYGEYFREFGMTALPAVSDVVIRMSGIVLQPGVLIVGGIAGLSLIVVGHFGVIDRALGALIVVDLLTIALLVVVWWVGLHAPMRQVHQQLSQ